MGVQAISSQEVFAGGGGHFVPDPRKPIRLEIRTAQAERIKHLLRFNTIIFMQQGTLAEHRFPSHLQVSLNSEATRKVSGLTLRCIERGRGKSSIISYYLKRNGRESVKLPLQTRILSAGAI